MLKSRKQFSVWFIFPTLLAVVAIVLYWRLRIRYKSLEDKYRELSLQYEEVAKKYEEAKRALEAAQRTISAHAEERDAARRFAAQKVKEVEAEVDKLKKALEEKERELASTKARLEEELQACVQSLNYLRGRYAELKPEEPLRVRVVDTHIAAQLPPRDIYRTLIEVP